MPASSVLREMLPGRSRGCAVQIEVTVRHGSISDNIREHLVNKSEKFLTYFERVTSIQITVDVENPLSNKVEILLDAEHKHDFVANSQGEDILATFDRAFHKMEQQVKKYKGQIQDHRRDRPMSELVSPEVAGEAAESESDAPDGI